MVNHHPGIFPKPPTRAPILKAPVRPNSTATAPKGSSRDGMRTNSVPPKLDGANHLCSFPGNAEARTNRANDKA